MTTVFAIQHKTTKCYFLFVSAEENVEKDASQLVSSKANKFFDLCPDMKNYKIGDVEDFDASIMNEISAKSGPQYEQIKEDEFCMNTNLDKCIELLNKKLSAKPRAKKAPAQPVEQPKPVIEETQPAEPAKPKPKPKLRSKKSAQIE